MAGMIFDWQDYLAVARSLYHQSLQPDNAHAEAHARSAISRAYYGAFCLARNYLRDTENDLRLQKGKQYTTVQAESSEHEYVIREFKNRSRTNKAFNRIAENLRRLRDERNTADYGDRTLSSGSNRAKAALKYADFVVNSLQELENLN